MMTFQPLKRIASLATVAALAVSAAACSDFLTVQNPGSVDADKLNDAANANLLVTGVIGEFQSTVTSAAVWGGVLSDELLNGHNNASYGPIDRRDFTNLNDIVGGIYSPPSRLRYAADSTVERLKGWLGAEAAARDVRVARMLAMAGYGYLYLGEMFCAAPIQLSAPKPSNELFALAQPRFDEAIAIAEAARAAGTPAAVVDSVLNLARVGAARAALNLGDAPRAREYAALVPATFEYRAYYSEGIPPVAGNPTNLFWNYVGSPNVATAAELAAGTNIDGGFRYSGNAAWTSVGERFQNLSDPRVPHTTQRLVVLNSSAGVPSQYLPNKPKSFGGYVAPNASRPGGQPITPGASIRVASGLEAQYIVAEADGGVGSTLAFVNAQRAANGQTASSAVSPDEILADLRTQRSREFYIDGHRLGDLRRYKANDGVDLWERGAYRGSSTDTYGTVECFPIPLTEINSNPNAQPGA